MTQYKTAAALAEKLISLPSYVDKTNDETLATDFLVDFLKANFSTMIIEKQYLQDSPRYNIILRGKGEIKLFALGHIDTVQPKQDWLTNPFMPLIKDGRLYGLGAADMKSSLVAFLWVLQKEQKNISLDNLLLLIYVDEEYDFLGIKRFINSDGIKTLTPTLTLSLDGELAIGSGCRGLIELRLTFKGKSGHAANPSAGVNAITKSISVLNDVSQELTRASDMDLGPTTTNVAFIQGGVRKTQGEQAAWLQEGNIIADTADIIFEVRPAIRTVTAAYVLASVRSLAKTRDLTITATTIRHDIAPWPVAKNEPSLQLLKEVYNTANVPFILSDRALQGYIDAQMVVEKIPAPTFIIGTGGENKHAANESVPLTNIEQAASVYGELLRKVLL